MATKKIKPKPKTAKEGNLKKSGKKTKDVTPASPPPPVIEEIKITEPDILTDEPVINNDLTTKDLHDTNNDEVHTANNDENAGNTDIPVVEEQPPVIIAAETVINDDNDLNNNEEEIEQEARWKPGKRNPLTGMFTPEEMDYIMIHLEARMRSVNPKTNIPFTLNAQHFIRQCVNFCVNFRPGQTFGRANVEREEFE